MKVKRATEKQTKPTGPLVSVGIIFKNEIRCLERCLRSLAPLREAVACEVVMADTGSDDGSRAVAEHYADILFDFPWINDFAAARNAVMDRCTGRWYLSMDADEWLDEDVRELVRFLKDGKTDTAFVTVRNYTSEALDDSFQDSMLVRLLRMSTKHRFVGAIHEQWDFRPGTQGEPLNQTILHHDGYVGLNDDRGKAKRTRNMELLRRQLDENPQDLRTVLECIESSRPEPDHIDYIRWGLKGIEEQWPNWEKFGAPILRYAVFEADDKHLPEMQEWEEKAESLFPKSFFTRIDVEGSAAGRCWREKKYGECIRRSEAFLKALKEFRSGKGSRSDLALSTVVLTTPGWEKQIQGLLAQSCLKERKPGRALEVLETLDRGNVVEILRTLQKLHTNTEENTAPVVLKLFTRIQQDETKREELMLAFTQAASAVFSEEQRRNDQACGVVRPAYTMYRPLAGKCEVGTAAAVMESKCAEDLDRLLSGVENWNNFPVTALAYALSQGAAFPLQMCEMDLKEMDALAKRLVQLENREPVWRAAQNAGRGIRQLAWAWRLILAAMETEKWTDPERGMALARCFAEVEKEFLSVCCTPAMLEEGLFLLPPVHRFGWYCVQAFNALDAGSTAEYIRFLRSGLEEYSEMKPSVELLLEDVRRREQEKAVQAASPELLELAEKVRTMLAAYAPEDPAVAALKVSPAYQKVAYLIEGPEAISGISQ